MTPSQQPGSGADPSVMRRTVAGLAVRISRQVIKEELNEDRHTQLADDFVERLKKTHANRSR